MGGASITLALPWLEAMSGSSTSARAAGGDDSPPTRYVFTFCGSSIGPSTADDDVFVPFNQGSLDNNMAPALEPLEKISEHCTVVSNLEIPWVETEGKTPPPGGRIPQFHGVAQGPLLTGKRAQGSKGWEWISSKTSDQVVADAFGVDPLVVRAQADLYVAGNQIGHNKKSVSYGEGGSPKPPTVNPHRVFEQMFGANSGWTPPDLSAEERSARQQKLYERRSILDGIKQSYERLKKKTALSRSDRKRLEKHFAEVRSLERRLDELAKEQKKYGRACEMPDEPKDNWATGGAKNTGDLAWSNEDLRAEALTDLVYFSLVCNRTRVAAIQYTLRQSFMSAKHLTKSGNDEDVHELGHGGGDYEDVRDVHRWHLNFYAKLVDRLSKAKESDGSTVLDNTVVLYVPEGGHGFNPESGEDDQSHSTENMAVVVSGKPDKLVNGMHIKAPSNGNNHPANVYISAMDAVGVPNNHRLGEVQGVVPGLTKG
ncbi:MAG: DUF1552 domain-containing protein [Bradymonadaceae bacterium]